MTPSPRPVRNPAPADVLALLRRWGLQRPATVDLAAASAALANLMVDDAPPPVLPGAAIRHIRGRLHPAHRSILADAARLADIGEAAHARDDAWPHDLADELLGLSDALELHQQRENVLIFPMLLDRQPPRTPVAVMLAEHEEILARLDRICDLTNGFAAPARADALWRLLYLLCCRIDSGLREQLALENGVLFAAPVGDLTEPSPCPGAS